MLGPGGEFRRALGVGGDELSELGFGVGAVFGVEDAADLVGDFLLEILGGDVGLGVLLEVARRAARSPRWASEVTLSGMPMPRCLRLVKKSRQ